MNLGSVIPASIPSESVFNGLKLVVTDRRGSLGDKRADALVVSAQMMRMMITELTAVKPSNAEMTEEETCKLQDLFDMFNDADSPVHAADVDVDSDYAFDAGGAAAAR